MAIHELEQFETITETRPQARDRRLRRGIYLLPSFFTVANLLCGFYAVMVTLKGGVVDLDNAARAIGFAILFDALDGRIARATGTTSEFGKQFDSLADVVSFGIAPAILAFVWGVRGVLSNPVAKHLIQFGWLVAFAFVVFCAWRLARFNIGQAGGSRYFIGLPTPAAAGMIAAVVHAFWSPLEDWRISVLWLALVFFLGLLMASTIRYHNFKDVNWHRRWPSVAIVVMALIVGAIFFYSELTLLVVAAAYVLHGIVIQVVRFLRHRSASRSA